MPKKTGTCINVGGRCPKALSRERQEADVTNFKCEHCGGELREFKGSTGTDWKKIAIIGTATAALLGGGAYFAFNGDDRMQPEKIALNKLTDTMFVGETDTLIAVVTPEGADCTVKWATNNPKVATVEGGIVTFVAPGEVKIGVQISENKELKAFCDYHVENEPESEPVEISKPANKGSNSVKTIALSYGKYEGETKNGKPHGIGRLVYTEEHIINEHDEQERTAQPGESVQGQFVNGKITIGKHFDANGSLIQALNFGVSSDDE